MKGLFAVVVLAATLGAACTGDRDGGTSTPATGTGSAEIAFDPARQPPAPDVEGARRGGTVHVRSYVGVGSTDPSAWDATIEDVLSGLVTRSLTQYTYDPAHGTTVLVPDIATDLGRPNDDFTEWQFTIRDGVRFEDGTAVTAEDVAYGIKRSFDESLFGPGGPTPSNRYFLHGHSYHGPVRSGTDYAGVVVEGDTLTLKMARPFPELPYWAAASPMGPIPDKGSSPDTYWRHPMATGPYKFDDLEPGKSLTLVRNPQWDPETDPGRHQYPDRFDFRFTADLDRVEEMLLTDTGAGRTTVTQSYVSPTTLRAARHDAADRLVTGSSPCTFFLFPDNESIDEVEVRKALGYAFPYEEYFQALGQVPGLTVVPGTSMLPPGTPGRVDEPVLPSRPWQTDADKARALLRSAGYKPGEYELTFAFVKPDEVYDDLWVRAFERAGFKVTRYPTRSWPEYEAVVEDPASPVNLRKFSWCPDWFSGAGFLADLFLSGGIHNLSYFHEPDVDLELDRIRKLPFDEQPAAAGALERLIQADYYPAVVLGYQGRALIHVSRIEGMSIGSNGTVTWSDIYVA